MKINIGCGKQRFPGWMHIDAKAELASLFQGGEFQCGNALAELRLWNHDTFDVVFSEHLFEHLDMIETLCLARDAFATLKPGGVFRVAVPDALFRPEPEMPGEHGHKTWWCVDSLCAVLEAAGFSRHIVWRAWQRNGTLYDDTSNMPLELGPVNRLDSLIVDAIKDEGKPTQ